MTPIRTDGSNAFAHHTATVRFPALIDTVLQDNPNLPRAASVALRDLQSEVLGDEPLRLFTDAAEDHDTWRRLLAAHDARLGHRATWLSSEWFVFEHFFFRRIIDAVGYPDSGIDPFAPAKERELESPALQKKIEEALEPRRSRVAFKTRLMFAVWGNQLDLSHPDALHHAGATAGGAHEALIVDDTDAAWRHARKVAAPIHIVCDNAATELAADLCLADWFLNRGISATLHVKAHPTFVSDATEQDVRTLLARLLAGPSPRPGSNAPATYGGPLALANRLVKALSRGDLRVRPDRAWNLPLFFDRLPEPLAAELEHAGFLIIKGDMNYRRLLRDCVVPATDPIERWAPPMPAAALMLRTMKGDPVAGIPEQTLAALNAEHPGWRTAGIHGLIQVIRPGISRS